MDVTPTTVDTVNIQGAAALDGHLIVTVGNVATGRYTLLTATGGLNNTQFSIVSIIIQPPLGASISYDAQHVYLNVATCCD
jgi:hypothetical protein